MFSNTDMFIKIKELYKKYYEIISNDNKINNDIQQSRKLILENYKCKNYIYNANSSHIFDVCWVAYLKFDANINPNTKLSSAS